MHFDFRNPTKIIFGNGRIESLATEIPAGANILMTYGGGSIKKNGIYDQVKRALAGFNVTEFSGIPANPEYAVLMKAVEIVRTKKIDFLLAVGGGSVIDGTKFIAAAAHFEGDSPWDLLRHSAPIGTCVPLGTVLTLPATGSEMNFMSVVTREETKEKLAFGGPGLFPVFSILDPQVIQSIPRVQLANGITDAFVHVLEQYATYPAGMLVQDRFAEGILQTLVEIGPRVIENPADDVAASSFMWCCTVALNGIIAVGAPGDWAVHMMGHELTALFGIDHARTLAVIAPSHYRHNFEAKKGKLAQMAERVWGVREGTIEEKATAGIERLEQFFQSLGIDTKLSAYTDRYAGTAEAIAKRFTERGWMGLGEHRALTPTDVQAIVTMSY